MEKELSCSKCSHFCAGKVPIFQSLTEKDLDLISSLIRKRRFQKGQVLIREGDKSDALYFIHYGNIKLSKITIEGKEQILNLVSHGDFFGELHVLHNAACNFSAYALEDTEVCMILRKDFEMVIQMYPNISIKLLHAMTERLSHAENLLQTLATKDAEVRLVNLIIDLSEKFGRKTESGIEISLPMTREEMANYIGVTRETISRKLNKFEDYGYIRANGNKYLHILEIDKLHDLAKNWQPST
ncbi:MAG: cAMP-binding protein [Bacillales bacterium]|jgi:CRP/FNR family transcriptional regulator|nr:cAMP-binding protein [Bacillales bacterium]